MLVSSFIYIYYMLVKICHTIMVCYTHNRIELVFQRRRKLLGKTEGKQVLMIMQRSFLKANRFTTRQIANTQ